MSLHRRFYWLIVTVAFVCVGTVTIGVTSRELRAADENLLTLPSVHVVPGQQIVAALTLTQTTGTVYAADLRITYDPNVVSAVSVQKGSAISTWSLASNIGTPGQISIGLATGSSPLTSGGELLQLTFLADDQAGISPLTITQGDLNEGDVLVTLVNGSVVVNTLPLASDDVYSVDEDDELNVLAPGVLEDDTDADNHTLTATQVTGPSDGSLTLNTNGSFSYTPDADFYGSDSFTYRASDGQGGSDTATVAITVNPVNDNPAAVAGGPYAANEGASVTLDASGSSDIDNTAGQLTYEWDLDGNDTFETTGVAPSFSAATLDGPTQRTVKLRVRDSQAGLSVVSTAQVNVLNVAPTARPGGPYIVTTGSSLQLDGTASSDPAGVADPLSYLWDLNDDSTFETTGATPTFDATGLGETIVDIHLKVTDDEGKISSVASTTVTVQALPTYTISGHAYFWREARPLMGVQLVTSGAGTFNATTHTDGAYTLSSVPADTYTLSASKTDATTSITAYDAALVLRHVSGTETLSGDAAISADVNQTVGISALDASLILQRSVGLISLPFADGGSIWGFEPSNYSFAPLSANQSERDFIGILFGDVSGNWGESSVLSSASTQEESWLRIEDQGEDAAGNQIYSIVLIKSLPDLYAVTIDLGYVAGEGTLQHITPVLRNWMFAYNAQTPGLLKFSLAGTEALRVGDTLVELQIKPTDESGAMQWEIRHALFNESAVITTPSQQFLPLLAD